MPVPDARSLARGVAAFLEELHRLGADYGLELSLFHELPAAAQAELIAAFGKAVKAMD